MKRVISISIGSSQRDHRVETEILNEKFIIERIGTDGSIPKAIELIKRWDGKVDAFGLGGIDLYLTGANRNFMIKEAVPIVNSAIKTPIVDGSGIKNTLEKDVVKYLQEKNIINFKAKKVLMVCAADRFKMAEGFIHAGCNTTIGDLIFALNIPLPIKNIKVFKGIITAFLPIVSLLPYHVLYPIGEQQMNLAQNTSQARNGCGFRKTRFEKFYNDADIIAGDFIYIKKYLPDNLHGKTIITNTVTQNDIAILKQRGVKLLITTTPEFSGRSFGTNVIEAILIAASGKKPEQLSVEDYIGLIKQMHFLPRVEYLN